MNQIQQDFEVYFKSLYSGHILSFDKKYEHYTSDMLEHMWEGWKAAHNKYSQDNQKYIDLLKDIYYNYELPNEVDMKIEKLLGDLL